MRQLPQEARRFAAIDKNYEKVCGRTSCRGGWQGRHIPLMHVCGFGEVAVAACACRWGAASPPRPASTQLVRHVEESRTCVGACCSSDVLQNSLPGILQQLEIVQKSLSTFLGEMGACWSCCSQAMVWAAGRPRLACRHPDHWRLTPAPWESHVDAVHCTAHLRSPSPGSPRREPALGLFAVLFRCRLHAAGDSVAGV